MSRDELHATFVWRFSILPPTPVVPACIEALLDIEKELGITFPAAYCDFLTRHGPIFTPDILALVTGGESEQRPEGAGHDVQEFLAPGEIVTTYRMYVSGGMEDWLAPIAMDSGGNMFGFKREVIAPRPDDSALFFFDHDFCEISQEAPSFDIWLESFLKLQNPPT